MDKLDSSKIKNFYSAKDKPVTGRTYLLNTYRTCVQNT